MSTATSAPMTLDVSQTARVPFSRLVSVELRKMFDTRAGRWLLISIAAFTALVLIIQLWVVLAQDQTVTFEDFAAGANIPMNILLPVLGVMSVTSEWSQRTAMVTFTLEPSRTRFLAAKFVGTYSASVMDLIVTRDEEGDLWVKTQLKGEFVNLAPDEPAERVDPYGDAGLIQVEGKGGINIVYAFLDPDADGRFTFLHTSRALPRSA